MEVDEKNRCTHESCKSEVTDLESASSPRNNPYVLNKQENDSPHSKMTINRIDSSEKSKLFHADIVADKTKNKLTINSINAIDQEVYAIYNRDSFKVKKNILTYECQCIFPGEIFRDVYHGKDVLQTALVSRVDFDEFGMQIEDMNINDIYVRTGQFVGFIKKHLYDINQLVEKKYTETNTFTKTFKLGFRLKPIQADKRAICYIKFVESLELLKMILKGLPVHHSPNKSSAQKQCAVNISSSMAVVSAIVSPTTACSSTTNACSNKYNLQTQTQAWSQEQIFHLPTNGCIAYDYGHSFELEAYSHRSTVEQTQLARTRQHLDGSGSSTTVRFQGNP